MTPQAARHRRQPRPVQHMAARRAAPECCGSKPVRVVCHCGNAYACNACGAELHAQHPEEA